MKYISPKQSIRFTTTRIFERYSKKNQLVFKHRFNNRVDYLKEHFIELRNNIQLVTEKFYEQINNIN